MATLTVRDLPEQVHRALRTRAALKGRSTEAEACAILEETVLPEGRIPLGALLASVGRYAGLTDEEFANFARRSHEPSQPADLA